LIFDALRVVDLEIPFERGQGRLSFASPKPALGQATARRSLCPAAPIESADEIGGQRNSHTSSQSPTVCHTFLHTFQTISGFTIIGERRVPPRIARRGRAHLRPAAPARRASLCQGAHRRPGALLHHLHTSNPAASSSPSVDGRRRDPGPAPAGPDTWSGRRAMTPR